MTQPEPSVNDHIASLVEDARALLSATSDATGDKITAARKRLASALEGSKKMIGQVKDQAVAGAKATDAAVRGNPYAAIAISLGVGAIVGFALCRAINRDRGR